LIATSTELSDSSPLNCLLQILNRGGSITKPSDEISIMLNGLRCYSLEVTLDQSKYIIQGYEQEAVDLFDTAMTILSFRNKVFKIIEG
jgi:hypothetical protein